MSKKNERIEIRLNTKDKELIEKLARKEGISVSFLIRKLIREKILSYNEVVN